MEYFDYITRSHVSRKQNRGIVTAENLAGAEEILKRRGEDIIRLAPMTDFLQLRRTIYTISARVSKKIKLEFFTMLQFMLTSGMSLHESLTHIRDSAIQKSLRNLGRNLADEVRRGAGLSTAMRRSRQFDDTIIEQIRSGEESGHIGDSLSRLVQQLTRELEFKSKIKSAMMYPVMICIVMIAVLWVMMTLVVPSLAGTLLSMGGELPLITRIVIGISNIMSAATPYTVILVVLSVMAYRMAVRIPDVRLTVDGCKLKLPIIGTMLEKIELARAARNLSALLESGIPLCSALGITQKAAKNRQTAVWFLNACRFVEMSGMNLAAALSKSGRFPAKFLQLVEVGINSGQICEILNRVAEQYEKEVDTALKRVTSLIEPLMIVFVGLIAGTVVISIFLPMFSISDML